LAVKLQVSYWNPTVIDTSQQNDMQGGVDIVRLASLLWHRRWLVIICILLFSGAFASAAFMLTPIYRATAVLVPASSERSQGGVLGSAAGQLGGLASLAGISVNTSEPETVEALSVLQSRQFTERFIAENNLMPVLFAKKWDTTNARWKVPEAKQPTPEKAYEYFNKIRIVTQDKKTGLVTIQIDWKDRNQAATWTNELVQRLNAEMRSRAIARTDASVGYLGKELKVVGDTSTQEAINRLIEAEMRQRMLANVSEDFSFRFIDRAVPADADEPIFPRKALLILLGPVIGFVVSLALLLALYILSGARSLTKQAT
jgi:uncharacterized protein involved in exopolysaccharide biosynthesis